MQEQQFFRQCFTHYQTGPDISDADKKRYEEDKFQIHFKQHCAGHQTCVIELDTEDVYNEATADGATDASDADTSDADTKDLMDKLMGAFTGDKDK